MMEKLTLQQKDNLFVQEQLAMITNYLDDQKDNLTFGEMEILLDSIINGIKDLQNKFTDVKNRDILIKIKSLRKVRKINKNNIDKQ